MENLQFSSASKTGTFWEQWSNLQEKRISPGNTKNKGQSPRAHEELDAMSLGRHGGRAWDFWTWTLIYINVGPSYQVSTIYIWNGPGLNSETSDTRFKEKKKKKDWTVDQLFSGI